MIKTVCIYSMLITVYSFTLAQEICAWTVSATFESLNAGQSCGDGNEGSGDGLYSCANDADSYAKVSKDIAHTGKNSAKFIFFADDDDDINMHAFHLGGEMREGDEVWMRWYMFTPNGFSWANGKKRSGIVKILRFGGGNASGTGSVYHSALAANAGAYYNCGPDGGWYIVGGSEGAPCSPISPKTVNNCSGIWDAGKYIKLDSSLNGKWHSYEMYIKWHSDKNKGLMRIWIDGVLQIEWYHATLSKSTDVVNKGFYGNNKHHFWGAWNGGPEKDKIIYIDDVTVTNERPAMRDARGNYMLGSNVSYSTTSNSTISSNPVPPPPTNIKVMSQ